MRKSSAVFKHYILSKSPVSETNTSLASLSRIRTSEVVDEFTLKELKKLIENREIDFITIKALSLVTKKFQPNTSAALLIDVFKLIRQLNICSMDKVRGRLFRDQEALESRINVTFVRFVADYLINSRTDSIPLTRLQRNSRVRQAMRLYLDKCDWFVSMDDFDRISLDFCAARILKFIISTDAFISSSRYYCGRFNSIEIYYRTLKYLSSDIDLLIDLLNSFKGDVVLEYIMTMSKLMHLDLLVQSRCHVYSSTKLNYVYECLVAFQRKLSLSSTQDLFIYNIDPLIELVHRTVAWLLLAHKSIL
ncbi:hypothetical protein ACOME3_008623 [Neoechinorhynchus agilis]